MVPGPSCAHALQRSPRKFKQRPKTLVRKEADARGSRGPNGRRIEYAAAVLSAVAVRNSQNAAPLRSVYGYQARKPSKLPLDEDVERLAPGGKVFVAPTDDRVAGAEAPAPTPPDVRVRIRRFTRGTQVSGAPQGGSQVPVGVASHWGGHNSCGETRRSSMGLGRCKPPPWRILGHSHDGATL
jgi:hypothetical protein